MNMGLSIKCQQEKAAFAWGMRMLGAIALSAMLVPSSTLAARDVCDMLKAKGILNDVEYNECKAAQEKKDAETEAKTKDVLGLQLPKWVSMITPFGDVRTRYEGFWQNAANARNRFRFRARLGLNVVPSDEVSATFRLATGNPDDPISTNQSFERTFTRKPVNFDQAYITVRPGKTLGLTPGWGSITGGKFSVPAYRVSEMVWDDDLVPEGAAETLNLIDWKEGFLRNLRVNAFQWVIDEIATANDPWMLGGQIVADNAIGSLGTWSIGMADYYYQNLDDVAAKFISPTITDPKDPTKTVANGNRNSQLAISNSVDKDALGNIIGYSEHFNILNWTTELNFANPFGLGFAAGAFADIAYNTQASERNVGSAIGLGFGNAGKDWYHDSLKTPGDWGVAYTWQRVEQNAVFAVFSYSDIDYSNPAATQKGSSNVNAHILRLDYMLLPNLQLTMKTHFINALDTDVATVKLAGNPTLVRMQVDAQFKF